MKVQAPSQRVNAASSVVRSCGNSPTSAKATTPPSTVPATRYTAFDIVMPGVGCATIATHNPALEALSSWMAKATK